MGAYTIAQTTTAIQNAIAGMINNSPAALDTLKELAAALGNDPNFAATTAQKLGEAAPSGMIAYFASASSPTGWLKANGAAVSRSTYAQLFAVIGTHYGAGNGSTTFNLPDLRGEFIRGLDDGRNVDNGRTLGSHQSDSIPKHYHGIGLINGSDDALIIEKNWAGAGENYSATGINGEINRYSKNTINGTIPNNEFNHHIATASQDLISGETRPRNIALLACIKI